MLRAIELFRPRFTELGMEIVTPKIVQVLSEEELVSLLPSFDGWIIGDDPATVRVLKAGVDGKLKAAVKWGAGVDNVDLVACRELGLPITNTPGMFGLEVADIALGYVIALARETFAIDSSVRQGEWIKPSGISLAGRRVALVGFGDIGRNIAKRLLAAEMTVVAYDPFFKADKSIPSVETAEWPDRLNEADFLVLACALTPENCHLVNRDVLEQCRTGIRVVNVARGGLIDEKALNDALQSGRVHSAALEVMEVEPLPSDSPLRNHGHRCLFGSHNSSNSQDAVIRTSERAIVLLAEMLGLSNAEQQS